MQVLPLEVTEVASGTQIFDWTVPREWNIADAWISDASGSRIVDFRESNLHVVGYSTPVHQTMKGSELRERLHVHPEHPEWVPARTAYWADTWGFCVTERTAGARSNPTRNTRSASTRRLEQTALDLRGRL